MAAHRYWRLKCDRHRGSGYDGFLQTIVKSCEMRATVGGSNIATNSSNAFGSAAMAGSSEGPAKAFDGSDSTFWQGASTWTGADQFAGATWADPHILGYDFGSGNDTEIEQIAILWWSDYFNRAPTHFVVESSDDAVAWNYEWECFPGDAERSSNVLQVYTRPQVTEETATKWAFMHLRGSTTDSRQGVHLAVANIYFGSFGYVGSQTISGSEELSGYPWSNAGDGSLSTFGHSNIQQAAFVAAEFAYAPGRPISVTVWPRQDGYGYQLPIEWALGFMDEDARSIVRVSDGTEPETFTDDIYSVKQYQPAPPVFEEPTVVEYTGDWETFTVQEDGLLLTKLWGGAGHGGQYGGGKRGGGGGYVYAELIVQEGDVVAVQVASGGRNRPNNDDDDRGTGGWPDGGTGSYGDTWGGGGGGSTRVWINGELAAVAGGGGGSAGYSGQGGGGGGYGSNDNDGHNNTNLYPYYGTGGAGTVDGPYLPSTTFGWKIGRGIPDVGALGRTGGHGGDLRTGTGDDGGGGGGGFYGGGGGGGDGCSAGGGASWLNSALYSYGYETKATSRNAARSDDEDYPGTPIAYGQVSNTQDPAGDGLVVFAGVALEPGGDPPATIWRDAFDRPGDTGSSDFQGYTVRCRIGADQFIVEGNTLRIGFRGLTTNGFRVDELWAGIGSDPATDFGCQFTDTPVQVTWNNGTLTALDLEPGEQVWSDPIEFEVGTDNLLISAYFDTSAAAYVARGYSASNDKWIGYNGDPTKVVPVQNVWAFWSNAYAPASLDAPGTGSLPYGGNDPFHFVDGILVAEVAPEIDIEETTGSAAATSSASAVSVSLGNGTADGHASATSSGNAVGQAVLPGDMQGTATATSSANAISFIPGVAFGTATATASANAVSNVRRATVGTATAASGGSGNSLTVLRRPTVGSASATSLAIGQMQTLGPNPATGLGSGQGTALGQMTVIAARAGTATATSTANAPAIALGTIEMVGAAFGYSETSSGVFATGVLNVVGEAAATSSADAAGTIVTGFVGEAAATSSADAAGSYVPTPAVGRATGTGTAIGFIERFAEMVGRAFGEADVRGRSTAFSGSVGIATTTSAGWGRTDSAREMVGSAAALSTAAATAISLTPTVGTATAQLTADGVGTALSSGIGEAIASSTAAASSVQLAIAIGNAAATSAAQGRAQAPTSAVGSATASSAADATGGRLLAAVGSATATVAVLGIGAAPTQAIGRAMAISNALGISSFTTPGVDLDDLVLTDADDWLIEVPLREYELVIVAADDAIVVVPAESSAAVAA